MPYLKLGKDFTFSFSEMGRNVGVPGDDLRTHLPGGNFMSASNSKKPVNSANSVNNQTASSAGDQFVDVLYQKLGENWFAFSLIDDEVFMSPVSDDKIAEIKTDNWTMTNEAA